MQIKKAPSPKARRVHIKPPKVTIQDRLACGGMLSLRLELCPLAGVSAATAYKHVKAGHLKLTKIGRKTFVAADDAVAYLKGLRSGNFQLAV